MGRGVSRRSRAGLRLPAGKGFGACLVHAADSRPHRGVPPAVDLVPAVIPLPPGRSAMRTGSRRTRFGVIARGTIAATLLLSSSVAALELRWSSGEANLGVTTSQPCTLLVRASLGEELPDHCFLNWVGNIDFNGFLQPQAGGPSEGAADICSVSDSATVVSRA